MTVGERNDRTARSGPNNHGGKILRFKDDGTVPADNPFVGKTGAKPEIFSWAIATCRASRCIPRPAPCGRPNMDRRAATS